MMSLVATSLASRSHDPHLTRIHLMVESDEKVLVELECSWKLLLQLPSAVQKLCKYRGDVARVCGGQEPQSVRELVAKGQPLPLQQDLDGRDMDGRGHSTQGVESCNNKQGSGSNVWYYRPPPLLPLPTRPSHSTDHEAMQCPVVRVHHHLCQRARLGRAVPPVRAVHHHTAALLVQRLGGKGRGSRAHLLLMIGAYPCNEYRCIQNVPDVAKPPTAV